MMHTTLKTALAEWQGGHSLHFDNLEQMALTHSIASRLLLAAGLGAAVGLERELHRKASGVRTNLLICFGSAMFTFLSPVLAGEGGNNRGQIAANIVQGIGFLGAGLILHNRERVNGLTSAATVFAVAAIGMACGAGLHVLAIFATAVVIAATVVIGSLEHRLNLKPYSLIYELRAQDVEQAKGAALHAMDLLHRRLEDVTEDAIGALHRLSFEVAATDREHKKLLTALGQSPAVGELLTYRVTDED
jgi:putative Mg2+ transporter-C (MgtC) family protein